MSSEAELVRRGFSFFFFNDTATTEIYTLSLHDALPISSFQPSEGNYQFFQNHTATEPTQLNKLGPQHIRLQAVSQGVPRSEEHTSELQSRLHLVCRLLLEKQN